MMLLKQMSLFEDGLTGSRLNGVFVNAQITYCKVNKFLVVVEIFFTPVSRIY